MLSDAFVWHGRDDLEDGDLRWRWHHKANQPNPDCGIALVGFASDLGVAANKGRIGARNGPDAIRTALANQAWHSVLDLTDAGTVTANADLPACQEEYAQLIARQLNQHAMVIGLGGGHEIAWGSYQGLRQSTGISPDSRIGIINFDAHFDLRKPAPSPSSGTPFRQIAEHCNALQTPFHYCCLGVAETANTPALFEYAEQSGTQYLFDYQCSTDHAIRLLEPFLENVDELYVTICLDALPASMAPGVSSPSPLGIDPHFVIDLLHWLGSHQQQFKYKWRLTDVAEMNPEFDIDNRTAKLAARLIHEVVKTVPVK